MVGCMGVRVYMWTGMWMWLVIVCEYVCGCISWLTACIYENVCLVGWLLG